MSDCEIAYSPNDIQDLLDDYPSLAAGKLPRRVTESLHQRHKRSEVGGFEFALDIKTDIDNAVESLGEPGHSLVLLWKCEREPYWDVVKTLHLERGKPQAVYAQAVFMMALFLGWKE